MIVLFTIYVVAYKEIHSHLLVLIAFAEVFSFLTGLLGLAVHRAWYSLKSVQLLAKVNQSSD